MEYADHLGTRLPVTARRSRELVLAGQELVAAAKLYSGSVQLGLRGSSGPGNGDSEEKEGCFFFIFRILTGNIRGIVHMTDAILVESIVRGEGG
jgi:hypothetical protein